MCFLWKPDCEEKRHFDEKLIQYVFLEPEIAWIETHFEDADVGYTALWTMKESLLKFLGEGLVAGRLPSILDTSIPHHFITRENMASGYVYTVCESGI